MGSSNNNSLLFKFLKNYSVNNLGSIWYCIVAAALQIYIITQSIYRFTAYVTLPWPNAQPPTNSVNCYMFFIGSSIILLPFFIVVALMKSGNYSNDGRKIGIFSIQRHIKFMSKDNIEEGHSVDSECDHTNWLKLVWKHSVPVAPMLHLMISFCFLFPRLMSEAQLIRHGFLSKADIWKTDLDFLLSKYNGILINFFGLLRTINKSEQKSIFSDSTSIGQYFIKNSKSLSEKFGQLDESGTFSIEFFNFVLALFIITVRYPAVFWRVNKSFSLIFSLQLVMNFVQSVITFSAFQIAYKIFVCDPTHLLIRFRESSSLNLVQLSMIFVLYFVVLHFSAISLYVYGIQKYREYRYARTKHMQLKYESNSYANFVSYLLAMVFFLVLTLLIGPLFYEFVIIYCGSLSISALLIIISTIIYFTFWIILWVSLAIKTNWSFNYDDIESDHFLTEKQNLRDQSSLVIINNGKTYKIKEDAAKQAILNFAQNKLCSAHDYSEDENCTNAYMDRFKNTRMSTKSLKIDHNSNHSNRFNKNQTNRSSVRSYRNKSSYSVPKGNYSYQDISDSDGEYISFQKLNRSQSFSQKSCLKKKVPAKIDNGEYGTIMYQDKSNLFANQTGDKSTDTSNMIYGFNYMCNSSRFGESEPSTRMITDKCSDTSSGIHSDASNLSIGHPNDQKQMTNSNSLESLMHRLEAAASDKPYLRSLSSLQQSINLLNQFDSNHSSSNQTKLTSFSNENAINKSTVIPFNSDQSKLAEFTENPDYTRYYSLTNNSIE